MASPDHGDTLQDLAEYDSSEDSSVTEESAEEGEFEIIQTCSTDTKRLPKYKLCGAIAIESSSGNIKSLATSPKDAEEIYLTNQNDNDILVTSLQGEVTTKLDNSKILLDVEDIAVSDSGNVIIVAKCNDIHVYDRDGNMVHSFRVSPESNASVVSEDGAGGLEITSVDIDRNRKIAIGCCDGGKGIVLIYEMDGEFKRSISFNVHPVFISSRYLLVAASDPKRKAVEVRHNDKTGELIHTLQMKDLGPKIEPCGVLLTWDHLFVVTRNTNQTNGSHNQRKTGALQLYDTNSMAYLGVAVSGLSNPCAIDVTSSDKIAIADEREIKLFRK